MQTYKVVIADDHPELLESTRKIVQSVESVDVVGIAENGEKCLELIDLHGPDLVVLDYLMPDLIGTELAARIAVKWPKIKTVILSGFDMSPLMERFKELHIRAVMEKDIDPLCMVSTLHCVLCDRIVLPENAEDMFAKARSNTLDIDIESLLTEEEIKIMDMVAKGHTSEKIATTIQMSRRTADHYISRICRKLEAKNKAEAIGTYIRSSYFIYGNKN